MAGITSILAEITARLGNRTDLSARIPVWLNDYYAELLLSPRFAFWELDQSSTFVTVASTREYSLSSITDLWFILDVVDETNDRRLDRRHIREFDNIQQPTATDQQPTRYARFSTTLHLDPTPGGIYTIRVRYRKRPTELTAGGSHLLGREWDEPLIVGAVVKGWEALQQTQKAAEQKGLLEAQLAAREEPLSLEDADAEFGIEVEMGWI